MQVSQFFNKTPALYRYLETIIVFKWHKQDSLSSSIGLSQDEACSDLFENLSVNILMGDLSNATNFKPSLFSLVNTFNRSLFSISVPVGNDTDSWEDAHDSKESQNGQTRVSARLNRIEI